MKLSEKNQSNEAESKDSRSKRHQAGKIILSVAAVVVLATAAYVPLGKYYAKSLVKSRLRDKGYQDEEIRDITVRHSFVNKLLSYGEWDIDVVFQDEQDVTYTCRMTDWKLCIFDCDLDKIIKGNDKESAYASILHPDWIKD